MSLKQRIDADLKRAMLARDKTLTMTLRGLKSVILYAEVAAGNRDEGLGDEEIIQLLAKESKKRQESADLYVQGGNTVSAEAELKEKVVIAGYLPEQLSDQALDDLVNAVLGGFDAANTKVMGQIITKVKQRAGATADSGRIAAAVKRRITA